MAERLFKRKIYAELLNWKRESDGKSALLVEGARRVGKSTIVETFAKNEYESYLLIDFNNASKAIKDLFNDLMDLDYLFLYLQTTYHVTLVKRKSVIIFDEVQKCPMARQAIKFLVEDGRYDYIETGSLISIKKNTEGITIPSEEDRIQMNPMDFEEFRWALGDEATLPLLQKFWEQQHPLGPAHRGKNVSINEIMGSGIDVRKLRSCMKLFNQVAPNDIFQEVLDAFFPMKEKGQNYNRDHDPNRCHRRSGFNKFR